MTAARDNAGGRRDNTASAPANSASTMSTETRRSRLQTAATGRRSGPDRQGTPTAGGGGASEPVGAVDEAIDVGSFSHQHLEGVDVAPDVAAAPRQACVRGEDQTVVGSVVGGPESAQDREVCDVVGKQRAPSITTQGQERFVVLGLPARFTHGDGVVAPLAESFGDQRRVVVVKGQPHANVACSRSQWARSVDSTCAAHAASASISSENSA